MTQQPVIELRDAGGDVVDDDETGVTVTVDQGGVLGGTTTVSAVDGVVSYTDLTLTGTVDTTYTLTFTAGGLRTTGTVTVAPVLFTRADNGVTVLCRDASVGDEGDVDGVRYTKRARTDVGATLGLDTLVGTGPGATGWDLLPMTCTSGIESFNYLFSDLDDATFNVDVVGWDTSSVTNMISMFNEASVFDQDIGGWDVSSVTSMDKMFEETGAFDQDIGGWDTSKVATMDYMFLNAAAFDQYLGSWCVPNVPAKPERFDEGADNWTSGRPKWGECPVDD